MVRNVVVWNSWKTTVLAALILGFNIFDGSLADGNIGKFLIISCIYYYRVKGPDFLARDKYKIVSQKCINIVSKIIIKKKHLL